MMCFRSSTQASLYLPGIAPHRACTVSASTDSIDGVNSPKSSCTALMRIMIDCRAAMLGAHIRRYRLQCISFLRHLVQILLATLKSFCHLLQLLLEHISLPLGFCLRNLRRKLTTVRMREHTGQHEDGQKEICDTCSSFNFACTSLLNSRCTLSTSFLGHQSARCLLGHRRSLNQEFIRLCSRSHGKLSQGIPSWNCSSNCVDPSTPVLSI